MVRTTYVTLEQILVIHQDQIERYGGTSGIRTLSLLESAVLRPQSTFNGKELYTDIFEKAASLMHSLIRNHPFMDGNKRTGIVAGCVFLEINGVSLRISQEQLVTIAISIATKKMGIESITKCLKEHIEIN